MLHQLAARTLRSHCVLLSLQTVLVVSQDGANEEITELINGVDFMPVVHLHHTQPYWNIPSHFIRSDFTTASNVFFLLRWAFDYAHVTPTITNTNTNNTSPLPPLQLQLQLDS